MIRDFIITLKLPSWARWYAVDESGEVFVYENKPVIYCNWWGAEGQIELIMTISPCGFDWTQTLHEIERAA